MHVLNERERVPAFTIWFPIWSPTLLFVGYVLVCYRPQPETFLVLDLCLLGLEAEYLLMLSCFNLSPILLDSPNTRIRLHFHIYLHSHFISIPYPTLSHVWDILMIYLYLDLYLYLYFISNLSVISMTITISISISQITRKSAPPAGYFLICGHLGYAFQRTGSKDRTSMNDKKRNYALDKWELRDPDFGIFQVSETRDLRVVTYVTLLLSVLWRQIFWFNDLPIPYYYLTSGIGFHQQNLLSNVSCADKQFVGWHGHSRG